MPALPPTLRSLQLTHPRGLDDLVWLSRVENTGTLTQFLLTGNPKTDLAGIETWAGSLINLSLAHCADLPHLESLLLGGSGVVDLTPLAGRSGLRIADFGRHRFVGAELLGPGSEILTSSGVITSSEN